MMYRVLQVLLVVGSGMCYFEIVFLAGAAAGEVRPAIITSACSNYISHNNTTPGHTTIVKQTEKLYFA